MPCACSGQDALMRFLSGLPFTGRGGPVPYGMKAQRARRAPTQGVIVSRTECFYNPTLARLKQAARCHSVCRRKTTQVASRPSPCGWIENPRVGGSIPPQATKFKAPDS